MLLILLSAYFCCGQIYCSTMATSVKKMTYIKCLLIVAFWPAYWMFNGKAL